VSERAREGRAGERKKQRAGRPARERPPGKGRVGGGVSITGPAGFFRAERRYLFGRRHPLGFQPGSCPVTAFAGRCCEVEGPVGRGGPRAGADRPVLFRCDVRAPGGPEGPAGARPPPPGVGLPSGKQWENTSGWTTEQRHSRRRTVNRPRARARILVEIARPPLGSDLRSAKNNHLFFFRRLCTAVSPRCALRSSQKESSPAFTLAASSAGTRLCRRGRRGPRWGRASAFQVDRILRRVRGAPYALPAGRAEGGVLLASRVLAPLLASQVDRVRWLASVAPLWLPARKPGGGLLLAALVLAPLVHHVGRVQWLVSGAPLGLPAGRRGRFRARREITVDRGRR